MAHTTILSLRRLFLFRVAVVPCHRMRDCDKTAGIIRRGQNWMSRLLYWTGRDQSVLIFCRLFRNLDTYIYIDDLFCVGFVLGFWLQIFSNPTKYLLLLHLFLLCYVRFRSRILFDDQLVILASETGLDQSRK